MEELVFDPDIWITFEDDPQRFVLYDDRKQGARIVIFASNVVLQYLCTQDRWFMDGNLIYRQLTSSFSRFMSSDALSDPQTPCT